MELFPDLSLTSVANISNFLGENNSNVEKAFLLSSHSFLNIISNYIDKNEGPEALGEILEQGGHNGNLLRGFEEFSQNPEKLQMLDKIGSNILEHFLPKGASKLATAISLDTGIRKSSALSLFHFVAPLVLGKIGLLKKEKNHGDSAIANLFDIYRNQINRSLPPKILNELETKKIENVASFIPRNERISQKENIQWFNILPWVFLAMAGAFLLFRNKNVIREMMGANPAKINAVDSLLTADPSVYLPDSSIYSPPSKEVNKMENIKPKEFPKQQPSVVIAQPEVKSSKPKNESIEANSKVGNLSETEKSSFAKTPFLPNDWNKLKSDAFKRNSAEISSEKISADISSKIGNGIIEIAAGNASRLGEDRAYGLREALLARGVLPDNIKIVKKPAGTYTDGTLYKIK